MVVGVNMLETSCVIAGGKIMFYNEGMGRDMLLVLFDEELGSILNIEKAFLNLVRNGANTNLCMAFEPFDLETWSVRNLQGDVENKKLLEAFDPLAKALTVPKRDLTDQFIAARPTILRQLEGIIPE